MQALLIVVFFFALFIFWIVARTAVVVPQQNAYVVERLGRFAGVLDAGFHILVPFVDVIRYRHVLKEQAMDIPEQICITRDNVQVAVDGILYLKVMDPERASYGISNYQFAIIQLAQTTLRSEIGKIELDRTFEERTYVNTQVVTEVDKASEAWGVKVLRYEIKNITPPQDILAAMEKQMRAEREKRAVVSSRWPRPPPRGSAPWPRPSRRRAASRRCSSGWPSSTSRSSASSPARATASSSLRTCPTWARCWPWP